MSCLLILYPVYFVFLRLVVCLVAFKESLKMPSASQKLKIPTKDQIVKTHPMLDGYEDWIQGLNLINQITQQWQITMNPNLLCFIHAKNAYNCTKFTLILCNIIVIKLFYILYNIYKHFSKTSHLTYSTLNKKYCKFFLVAGRVY